MDKYRAEHIAAYGGVPSHSNFHGTQFFLFDASAEVLNTIP